MLRQQLPVHSPIPFRALAAATGAAVGGGEDARPRLLSYLLSRNRGLGGVLADGGTSALRIGLEILRDHGAEPVALPSYGCYDVATAVVGAGIRHVFYDLDPRTLSPDPDDFQRALSGGAGSVVVAPLYGFPVDWGFVREAAARYGAVVVEDAAQAHGGTWREAPPGRFGDLVVFSFGRGKGWTGGGGGALVVRDGRWLDALGERPRLPEPVPLAELGCLLRTWGQWALGRPSLYRLPRSLPGLGLGETRYREPRAPRAMARSSAAVAARSRAASDGEVAVRRRNAQHYRELLEEGEADLQAVRAVDGGEGGYLRFPVILEPAGAPRPPRKEEIRSGVEGPYPRALPDLPALALGAGGPERPRAEADGRRLEGGRFLAAHLVTLPTHSLTTAEERIRLVELLRRPSARRTRKPEPSIPTPRERTGHGPA